MHTNHSAHAAYRTTCLYTHTLFEMKNILWKFILDGNNGVLCECYVMLIIKANDLTCKKIMTRVF